MSIVEKREGEKDQLPRLERGISQLMELSAQLGLDPFPIDFEIVPPSAMHSFAAYGLSEHYSHWTYGQAFRMQKTLYDHGLARIYEMVVNANPSQAYLLENNPAITNLMVAAHVIGHVDFFKHNYLFEATNRDMPLLAAQRAERIRGYEQQYGREQVEVFMDAALTLTGHIDPVLHHRPGKEELIGAWKKEFKDQNKPVPKDEFSGLDAMRQATPPRRKERMPLPLHPDRDLLGFLRDFSDDLEEWQRDILDIVREDSYYFYPQMRTKICNEGYAVLMHKLLMHEMEKRGNLTDDEAESWWVLHSGVARPEEKDLNPYWFGMMLWQWLVDYYNGRVTPAENVWLEKNRRPIYPTWNGPLFGSPGIAKIREIMMVNDDISLIRNYFDYIPATRMMAYLHESFGGDEGPTTFISTTQVEEVKEGLLFMLSHRQPVIEVVSADYGWSELILRHQHQGLDLEVKYLEKTLPYLWKIWGYPVHLLCEIDSHFIRFTCEGNEVTQNPPEDDDYVLMYGFE